MIITSKAQTSLFFGYIGDHGTRLNPGESSLPQPASLYAERHVQLDIAESRITVSFNDEAERAEAMSHLAKAGLPPPWLKTHVKPHGIKPLETVPDNRATPTIQPPKPPVVDPFGPLVDVPDRKEPPRVPAEALKAVRDQEAKRSETKKAEEAAKAGPVKSGSQAALEAARAEAAAQAKAAAEEKEKDKTPEAGAKPRYTPERIKKMGSNSLIDAARDLGLGGMEGMSSKELREAIMAKISEGG